LQKIIRNRSAARRRNLADHHHISRGGGALRDVRWPWSPTFAQLMLKSELPAVFYIPRADADMSLLRPLDLRIVPKATPVISPFRPAAGASAVVVRAPFPAMAEIGISGVLSKQVDQIEEI
jgi:hypothetical protein